MASQWFLVFILLLIEFVLSAPQGYNYYSNQQRIYAQRQQAQRLQAQRLQAQNRYQQSYRTTRSPYASSVSRADSENAKFLGSQNLEPEDTERTLKLIRKKKQFLYGGGGNPCYFRSADQEPAEGRFLWDFNVYNVYPTSYGGGGGNGCGGFNSFSNNRPFRGGFFQNFLSLFIPGGALNPNRPFQTNTLSDSSGSNRPQNVLSDPDYDTSLDGTGTGGSVGSTSSISTSVNTASSLPPGQIVGSVANTVNGIIQQLSGNVRPPAYRGYG